MREAMRVENCPFCGGKAEAVSYYSSEDDKIRAIVTCESCGAIVYSDTVIDTYKSTGDRAVFLEAAHKEAKANAVEKWNRRVPQAGDWSE